MNRLYSRMIELYSGVNKLYSCMNTLYSPMNKLHYGVNGGGARAFLAIRLAYTGRVSEAIPLATTNESSSVIRPMQGGNNVT